MRDPAALAAQMAAHVNSHAVSKGYGATVTADDMMPGAVMITDLERRIDQVGQRIADQAARLEEMTGALGAMPDPTTPARPAGAAGHADAPLDPIEIERVNRAIASIEETEDF